MLCIKGFGFVNILYTQSCSCNILISYSVQEQVLENVLTTSARQTLLLNVKEISVLIPQRQQSDIFNSSVRIQHSGFGVVGEMIDLVYEPVELS